MAEGEIRITIQDVGMATAIQRKLSYLLQDAEVREGVLDIVKDAITPFVPQDTGELALNTYIEDDEIVWDSPYAHYQYEGVVYAPNKAVWNYNNIVGWRTPKGVEKYPTDRTLGTPGYLNGWTFGYTTFGTTHHWDKEMMKDRNARRAMNIRITAYLKRMAREKDL